MVQRSYIAGFTNVAPKESGLATTTEILAKAGEIGIKLKQASDSSKLTELNSNANYELARIARNIQTQYSSNPEEAKKQYNLARQDLYNRYSDGLDSSQKALWKKSQYEFSKKDDFEFDSWAFGQKQSNVATSLNNSINANLSMAQELGSSFDGNFDKTLLKFGESYTDIENFAKVNGFDDQKTKEVLSSYEQDYMKSFISGAIQTNPIEARKLLDDDLVKNTIKDKTVYDKLKKASENRMRQVNEIRVDQEITNTMLNEIDLFNQSLERPLSIVELEQATQGISPQAKEFLYRMNGYSTLEEDIEERKPMESSKLAIYETLNNKVSGFTGTDEEFMPIREEINQALDSGLITQSDARKFIKREQVKAEKQVETAKKLNDSQKLDENIKLHNEVLSFLNKAGDKTSDDFRNIQDRIYNAVDIGIITKKEGGELLNNITSPFLKKIKKEADSFNKINLRYNNNDYGFEQIEEFYNDNIKVNSWWKFGVSKEEKNADKVNQLKLYKGYIDNLNNAMAETGLSIADIQSLPTVKKDELIRGATDKTIKDFSYILTGKRPETLNEAKLNVMMDNRENMVKVVNEVAKETFKPLGIPKQKETFSVGKYTFEVE